MAHNLAAPVLCFVATLLAGCNCASPLDGSLMVADAGSTALEEPKHARRLVLTAEHGLCNRLRAIASAVHFAESAGRWLTVVWSEDWHCDCPAQMLFNLPDSFPNVTFVSHFDESVLMSEREEWDVYDLLKTEEKGSFISEDSPRDIFVRSAYRLNSTFSNWDAEAQVLSRLVPDVKVMRMVHGALADLSGGHSDATFIGVHIRSRSPYSEIPGLPRRAYSEEEWRTMAANRNASSNPTFVHRMQEKVLEEASHSPLEGGLRQPRFFVASDLPGGTENVKMAVPGVPVQFIDNGGSLDRTCRGLRYAVADLFVLARASTLYGSPWSAFTEVAASMAGLAWDDVQLAGRDF